MAAFFDEYIYIICMFASKIIEFYTFSLNIARMHRNIACLRVSTIEQDIEKNKTEILHLANDRGLGKVEFVEEKVSGRIHWKQRKIGEILENLNSGDCLLLNEFSRLGRSMLECMEIISIATQKGINICTVKGNWQLDGSIQSKVMAMVFSMASEIERDLISKRTKEGLQTRKDNGKKLGRPKGSGKSKLDAYKVEIEALLRNGSTKKIIAARYNSTPANLHNWMKKNNITKS
jgi:DNA invertase Pin-like site-specific DNA recombinase